MNKSIQLEEMYGLGVYPKRDLVIVSGRGTWLSDDRGNQYIDCVTGHGVASMGHCNPILSEAIHRQSEKLITCGNVFYNDSRAQFMKNLMGIVPSRLNQVFLCNSGSEAMEAAIKLARYSTGKTDFICAMRGFHGRTMGALSATFNPNYKKEFLPLVPGFNFVPYNNFSKILQVVKNNLGKIAGIILEPVQGEGGVHIGDPVYFKTVRDLCDRYQILLIMDEVQTGFCRTGRMFAHQHFSIEPDILCLAKAIAGGIPMGAVVCSEKVKAPFGKHGSTFGGNPLACAVADAVIEFMKKNQMERQSAEKGNYLLQELRKITSARIREIRGLGLMVGIELREKVKPYILALINEGLLVLPAGSTVLRLLPPLTIEYHEMDLVVEKIAKVLA